jgi:hypothetical protein
MSRDAGICIKAVNDVTENASEFRAADGIKKTELKLSIHLISANYLKHIVAQGPKSDAQLNVVYKVPPSFLHNRMHSFTEIELEKELTTNS